ncbi:RNase H family protein [Rhodococcus zopfii]
MLAAIHIRQVRTDLGPLTCAALATDDGVRLFTRDGDTDSDRNMTGLDAFAFLYEQVRNSSVRLHLSDAGLRRNLTFVSASFPAVEFVDTAFGPFGTLLRRASDAIGEHVAALLAADQERREVARTALPPLLVATDASKARKLRGAGLGCISETGRRRMHMAPEARSIVEGELLAIEMGIDRFRDRDLHILTDSRLSLAALDGRYHGRPGVAAVVDRIHEAVKGRNVTFSWVRGHCDHALNEAAHRLAVAARRCYEANVSPNVAAAIADNIVESLREDHPHSA